MCQALKEGFFLLHYVGAGHAKKFCKGLHMGMIGSINVSKKFDRLVVKGVVQHGSTKRRPNGPFQNNNKDLKWSNKSKQSIVIEIIVNNNSACKNLSDKTRMINF